ncbi:Retrovirus-related Pol poly [Paramuricea clavata]|uniref:Retrovirus-related Pol poly n=1 Tax=Paramuricea clavata TaxID=317549 RepID=A0A6S7JEJ5_PARCT|nr:Retrovirus-related Pol poly [Paramuricea clavata]
MDKVRISDEDVVCLASKQQIPNNLDLKNMKDSNNSAYYRTKLEGKRQSRDEAACLNFGVSKIRDVEIKLHVNPNVPPIAQPERRIPFYLRNKVAEELKRLEENDIIEDATGPTPWVSPIVAAPKPKNINEVRVCVDMRLPNRAIHRERHPSPTVDDIIHSLNGAKKFSKLDLRSGYHQLVLAPESRHITTFATHKGLKRYKRWHFISR